MIADEYVMRVRRRNPSLFAAEKISLRPEELARLLRHAYDAGATAARPSPGDLPEGFDILFGGKRSARSE